MKRSMRIKKGEEEMVEAEAEEKKEQELELDG